jgi:tetratricopeptide (TPR) repeat protein
MLSLRRHLVPALATLLAFAVSARPQSDPAGAEQFLAVGMKLHQEGDILGAIQYYERALLKDPTRVDARSNLGAAYVRLGRFDDAIEQYRQALEAVPDEPRIRFNLGLALYKRGDPVAAAPELETVLEHDPGNRSALMLLADCRLQMGDDQGVVDLLAPHEAELGDDRLFAYLFGTALIRVDQLQRGQQVIDRLLGQGETAESHLLIGAAHLRRKEYYLAVPELQKAVDIEPDLPSVHSLYGRALMGSGDRPAAAEAFRRELQRNPNDFEANLYLALILKDENRLDEARDYLRRAARIRPRDPGVNWALGVVSLANDQLDDAQRHFEAAVAERPDFSQAHVLLARVYYRKGRRDLGDRERKIVERLRAESRTLEGSPLPEEYSPTDPEAESATEAPR